MPRKKEENSHNKMVKNSSQNALTVTPSGALVVPTPALDSALLAWADATTDPASERRHDLLRDKAKAVSSFFDWAGKSVDQVTPIDVKTWQAELEAQGKAPATVYAMVSRISSFYGWVLQSPDLAGLVRSNPVTLARPKAPKAYQTESTKALDDDDVRALLRVVKGKSDSGDLVAKRDYAMLLFYLLTGMRRAEVAGLRWGNVKINDGLLVTVKVKGGEYVNREVTEATVKTALLDYLAASGRLKEMIPDSPLWTRHDRAGEPGERLTSHAFVKNLKAYARQAGIGDIHLHQTRHT